METKFNKKNILSKYPFRVSEPNSRRTVPLSKSLPEIVSMAINEMGEKCDTYGRWMFVKKRSHRKSRDSAHLGPRSMKKKNEGSCFRALTKKEVNINIEFGKNEKVQDIRCRKGKETIPEGDQGVGFGMHKVGYFIVKAKIEDQLMRWVLKFWQALQGPLILLMGLIMGPIHRRT